MSRLDWDKLLCRRRDIDDTKSRDDQRNEFERDYDRIVNSSAFRRLQDKAQVFPLERTDFIHTRLTHSLEVERLGAAMARDLYRQRPELFPGATEAEIESLVGTACLAHDIGNPPFGHAGEKSVQLWFARYFDNNPHQIKLNRQQRQDFLAFEGNAQTLRVVTRLQMQWEKKKPGLHLTYATLAVLMKYVAAATEAQANGPQSRTKPGYFTSEQRLVSTIWRHTGTQKRRHPLTFLVEAADDMAYAAVDIEDALKKRVIDLPLVGSVLSARLPARDRRVRDLLRKYLSGRTRHSDISSDLMRYQRFRIKILGFMLRRVIETFIVRYEDIMTGAFDDELVRVSDAVGAWEALRAVAKDHVYTSTPVSMMETTGDSVIRSLLDRFIPAVLGEHRHDPKHPDAKLYRLISPVWRSVFEEKVRVSRGDEAKIQYHSLQLVTDFICGMTDTYALSLLRQVSGIEPAYS